MAIGMHWANATALVLDGETETDKVRIKAVTPDEYAWNGFLVDKGIGPGAVDYEAALAAWLLIGDPAQQDWIDAADALVPPIPTAPQGATGGGAGPSVNQGRVFWNYMWALYKMGLYTLPDATPPVYA
jgi:hypothetical protein